MKKEKKERRRKGRASFSYIIIVKIISIIIGSSIITTFDHETNKKPQKCSNENQTKKETQQKCIDHFTCANAFIQLLDVSALYQRQFLFLVLYISSSSSPFFCCCHYLKEKVEKVT